MECNGARKGNSKYESQEPNKYKNKHTSKHKNVQNT